MHTYPIHVHTHICIPFITAATVQGALHVLLLSPVVHVYLHNWAMMKQTFITILQVHHLYAVFPAVQIRSAHMYFSIYMYECIPNVSLYRCLQPHGLLVVYSIYCIYCILEDVPILSVLCRLVSCSCVEVGGGGDGLLWWICHIDCMDGTHLGPIFWLSKHMV